MIRVSSLDAGMLYAETPEMPMHTMGVVILDPPPNPPVQAVRRLFEERMHLIAPLRRRLVEGPLKLGDPYWIEDAEFDLDNHLRRAAIPSPGSTRELAEFVANLAHLPLERSKPLWEVVLVEGVDGGRVAIVAKVHHAGMDGGQVVALLLGCLFDVTPETATPPRPEHVWKPEPQPSLAWFATDTARSLAAKPLLAARAIAEMATTIGSNLFVRRSGDDKPARLFEAPATLFNGALTPHRSVALADVAFEDLRTIKRTFDTTINDVVLAASCASLRSWLLAHGGLPERRLVVNVPVAIRTDDEDDEAGNRISMILVHLPVQLEDPIERLMEIRAETRRAKSEHGHAHGNVLQQFTDVLTNITVPWLLTHMMELYASTHVADQLPFFWNAVISNVPGPADQLYCAGAKVQQIYPLGPVQQGSGLNLTVLSTVDRLCFGAMACKELVPDVEDLGSGFVHEISVLKELTRK